MKTLVCALFLLLLFPTSISADHDVNINTADDATLETLTGIGAVKAQAIIEHRNANGPFGSVEDIQSVSGVGPATFANIKDHIVVNGGNSVVVKDDPEIEEETLPVVEEAVSMSVYEPPRAALFAHVGEDRNVTVGADTVLVGQALSREGSETLGTVRYMWNFGDGITAEGEKVMHIWRHPGKYVVVLNIAHNKHAASDRMVVTAHPAEVTIFSEEEDIVLANQGNRDLDVSLWHLRAVGLHFTIPENTIVLAGTSVRFDDGVTNLNGAASDLALLYPNGAVAAEFQATAVTHTQEKHGSETLASNAVEPAEVQQVVAPIVVEQNDDEVVVEKATSSHVAAVAEGFFFPNILWILALFGVIALGALAGMAARAASRDEFKIIEME